MNKWIFSLIQFFPLSTFAWFAFWNGFPTVERWLLAFQLGAVLGMIQLSVLLPQKNPLNRLVLAGNIYLILGGLAVYLKQWWYLQIYASLRESGIILLMALVGLASTFMTRTGFIAVDGGERKYSFWLLFATLSMLPFAIYFEGNRIYAAVLPIIFLAFVQRYISFLAKKEVLAET